MPLKPGALPMVAVSVRVGELSKIRSSFLHWFVDHCRHLTHLDVYGAALAEREVRAAPKSRRPGPYSRTGQHQEMVAARPCESCRPDPTSGCPEDAEGARGAAKTATRTTLDLRPGVLAALRRPGRRGVCLTARPSSSPRG